MRLADIRVRLKQLEALIAELRKDFDEAIKEITKPKK